MLSDNSAELLTDVFVSFCLLILIKISEAIVSGYFAYRCSLSSANTLQDLSC